MTRRDDHHELTKTHASVRTRDFAPEPRRIDVSHGTYIDDDGRAHQAFRLALCDATTDREIGDAVLSEGEAAQWITDLFTLLIDVRGNDAPR